MTSQTFYVHLKCRQVDKTTQEDVMKKSISCIASEEVVIWMLASRKRTKLSDDVSLELTQQWVYHMRFHKLLYLLISETETICKQWNSFTTYSSWHSESRTIQLRCGYTVKYVFQIHFKLYMCICVYTCTSSNMFEWTKYWRGVGTDVKICTMSQNPLADLVESD